LGGTGSYWSGVISRTFSAINSDTHTYAFLTSYETGTTSRVGTGRLDLGNGTASGTAGNGRGLIRMYGTSSGYTQIQTGNNTTSNITLTLPSKTGTIPTVSLSGTVLTITT